MKTSQFCSLQCSIFIVASIAATSVWAKVIFSVLALLYLIGQYGAYRQGD